MKRSLLGAIAGLFAVLPACHATVYEVGPEQRFADLAAVPWTSLKPDDIVNIHGRPTPYKERLLLSYSGAPGHPIVIQGVPGPKKEPAILDFKDATTPAQYRYRRPNFGRGGIIVSGDRIEPPGDGTTSHGHGYAPHDIVIRRLTLRGAYMGNPENPNTFFDPMGTKTPYAVNAAGVFIEMGSRITLEDLDISDCNNGVEVVSNGDPEQSYDITLRRCHIYNCGTDSLNKRRIDRDHIVYTEACRVEYDHCTLGPPRDGSGGSSLKDRSVGLYVHDCTILDGAHSLDIVDPEGSAKFVMNLPEFRKPARIENNVITNSYATYPLHLGGDKGMGAHHPEVVFKGNVWNIKCDQKKRYRVVLIKNDTPTKALFIGETWNLGSLTPGAKPSDFYLAHSEYAVVDPKTGVKGSIEFQGGKINGKIDVEQRYAPADRSTNYEGEEKGVETLKITSAPAKSAAAKPPPPARLPRRPPPRRP